MSHTDTRTGTLWWAEEGDPDRDALVLLHSLGTDSSMWAAQLPVLRSRRRLITIDLPGHGRSAAGAGPYRLEDLGGSVLAVADRAGLDRFDVCGISLSGLIALWLAIEAPDRVTSMVAANTAARIGTPEFWSERIRATRNRGMEGICDSVVPRFVTPEFARHHPHHYRALEEAFVRIDPVGYVGCCAALRDGDVRDSVPTITCPSLIIGGEEDVATPPQEGMWLHEHIPASRIEIIAGASHLSNLDQPERFNQAVEDFLGLVAW
ncbi:MAG: 3-oxoadipate enol-lactonase [Acidimicrobiia bacterium]